MASVTPADSLRRRKWKMARDAQFPGAQAIRRRGQAGVNPETKKLLMNLKELIE
jgi:hypothetical protein